MSLIFKICWLNKEWLNSYIRPPHTWREQFISLDSRSSSVSTDWQMGQPSPCRATLFNRRKLRTIKKKRFSSRVGLFDVRVSGNNNVMICNSGDDWLHGHTQNWEPFSLAPFCPIYHFQLQPSSFSSSQLFCASSAHKTLLQMNLED